MKHNGDRENPPRHDLPRIENMPRITQQELAQNLDEILECVFRHNTGLVITGDHQPDLVLIPRSWVEPYLDFWPN